MAVVRKSRAIVVGGGLSGLATAAYLGRAGFAVHLLERSQHLGGRAATTRRNGFSLNRGPHAIYNGGEAVEVLKELGVATPGGTPSLDGFALRDGTLHRLPVNPLSLLATTLFGLSAKAEASAWLVRLPKIDARALAGKSVSTWLGETGVRPDVRALFEAFFRLSAYANAPDVFSAETAVRQLQKASAGVLYVDGGWQTLVDGLAACAERAGAVIETDARAAALGREPQGSYILRLADGRSLKADLIVLALSPHEVAKLLETAGVAAPRSITDAVPVRMAALDLALSRLPSEKRRFVLGIDRPLYLSVHSSVAKLAPEDGALIHAGKYLADGDVDSEKDRAEIEALLDLAQPGWRDAVVVAEYLPRMVVAERLDLASEQGPAGRPASELPNLPGVFVAGDWTQGGSWLSDGSLGSARHVAKIIESRSAGRRAVA